MAGSYFPSKDMDLDSWFKNFVQVAAQHETELGITAYDIASISGQTQDFDSAMTQAFAALMAYRGASAGKKTARKNAEKIIRTYVKRFQVNPNVSDATRAALQIPIYKKPSGPLIPVVPQQLMATPHASGVNNLHWKPNGNKQGVLYVVQAKPSGNGEWTTVGVSTKTRYAHLGNTPGMPMRYRVAAQRAQKISRVSNEAGVYGG